MALPEHILRDIVANDDGYQVWWPSPGGGYLAAHHLREIADYLDQANAAWDQEIQNMSQDIGETRKALLLEAMRLRAVEDQPLTPEEQAQLEFRLMNPELEENFGDC